MKCFKSGLYTFAAALMLGAFSIGFAPTASAVSTYDAAASFSLTLTNVTDSADTQVTSGWEVIAFGLEDVFLSESGDATATASTNVINPEVSLGIFDSITQSSTSSGTATNGVASTSALTDLEINVDNFSGQALTFSFDWSVDLAANATGDADASASVDMLDDLGFLDILEQITQNSRIFPTLTGSFAFELADGDFNLISGFVDSTGSAAASVVPVPAAVWLFGSGLLGLVGVARRKA